MWVGKRGMLRSALSRVLSDRRAGELNRKPPPIVNLQLSQKAAAVLITDPAPAAAPGRDTAPRLFISNKIDNTL